MDAIVDSKTAHTDYFEPASHWSSTRILTRIINLHNLTRFCILYYEMALSHNDLELSNSRVWLAKIDILTAV